MRTSTTLVVALALITAAACARNRHADVLARAMRSAENRVSQRDSVCHGSAHRHRNLTEQVYMAFAKSRATEQQQNEDHSLNTLYAWCCDDAECRKTYYLTKCAGQGGDELEMFRYLTSSWHDRSYPLTQLLDESGICGGGGELVARDDDAMAGDGERILEKVLKKAWLLEMRLQACSRGKVQCAENQRFIFSPRDSEGHCACDAADVSCQSVYRRQHTSSSSQWTYSTAAIVITSVAVFVFIVLEVYKIIVQLRLFHEIREEVKKSHTIQPETTNKFVRALTGDQ